ncbi:hypothetical protein H0X32_02375 [Patescibacteria group bacterium]|nr:hypothetical protein [Patescibacteria group bacterium]
MLQLKTDFNGVLADMREPTRLALEEVSGLEIPNDRFCGKKLVGSNVLFFPQGNGPRRSVTSKEWEQAKSLIYDGHGFSHRVKPIEGVRESLHQLWGMGLDIGIVSSCWGISVERVWKWINFYDMPISDVVLHENHKTARYAGADVVVDDELRHLIGLLDEPLVTPILMLISEVVLPEKYAHITLVTNWKGVVECTRALLN